VVNARLSVALAKALNLQKNVVEDISEKISQISSLNVKINSILDFQTKNLREILGVMSHLGSRSYFIALRTPFGSW
jgi:hypothetical protein